MKSITPFILWSLFLMPVTLWAGLNDSLRSNDPDVRRQGLVDLLELSSEAGLGADVSVLRGPLYDEEASVRLAAIAVLRHRKIDSFNDDLMILLKKGVHTVRAAAAEALGILGTKETVSKALWKSLADGDPLVRREAVKAIDRLHGTSLGFYWDQDPVEYRRRAQEALRAYLQIGSEEQPNHSD